MKKAAIALVLIVSSLFVGCNSLVETWPERKGRYNQQFDLQMKMVVEDWDYIWLTERSSRLTQWHPYQGW